MATALPAPFRTSGCHHYLRSLRVLLVVLPFLVQRSESLLSFQGLPPPSTASLARGTAGRRGGTRQHDHHQLRSSSTRERDDGGAEVAPEKIAASCSTPERYHDPEVRANNREQDGDWRKMVLPAESSRRDFFVATVAATAAGFVLLNTGDDDAAAAAAIPSENSIETTISTTTITTADSSAAAAAATGATAPKVDFKSIFEKAGKRALGGGKAGASAAVVQVCSLMWLRTSMNYQYRYGGNLQSSLKTLWNEGGIPRLYQGLPFAIVQGPLSKFGDTAANTGILALFDTLPQTQGLPLPLKTACGSAAAGLWRILLMPIDTSKTAMQVQGKEGLDQLWKSVADAGSPGPLYRGAFAQAAATTVGHFPWFATYNFLNDQLPVVDVAGTENGLFLSLVRSAFLGLAASCVSDCTSNSLRVIKTTKQTIQLDSKADETPLEQEEGSASAGSIRKKKIMSYPEVVAYIIETDGVAGLFGRGLQTRLLTNAIQGAAFSVLWKYFQNLQ